MATPALPQNLEVQSANQEILVSWDLSSGATSYIVQRSADNVTYATLATISGTPLATSYLDTSAVLGTQYWYKVAASNTDGTSSYTNPQSAVATPTGEMCLSQIRLAAQQRADRVDSKFVSNPEWRSYINQAMFELYDLLITVYEDYYVALPIQFVSDGSTYRYTLPSGSNTFLNADTGVTFTPRPFYKMLGVDLAVNSATNAYVTVNKFQFIERNKYLYPNTSATAIYGVNNLQYRVMGTYIEFIPTPASGQSIRLWYIPRITELLRETDTTDVGISGWLEYVVVRAAIYALQKEESDTGGLEQQILFLKKRIEDSAINRDAGQPDRISNTRGNGGFGDSGFGGGWSQGGGW